MPPSWGVRGAPASGSGWPDLGLRHVEPPLDTGEDEQFLLHPARLHTDPASIWMRRVVLEIGRGLA